MHAHIITGGTQADRAGFVADKSTGLVELVHLTAEKSSITIKQIQTLITSMSTHARLPRIIWIEEAGSMTTPAQNALLKSLEEPPAYTTFYLTTNRPDELLPTIRSRALLISLSSSNQMNSTHHLPLVKRAMQSSAGDRLLLVSELPSDRAEARLWLTELLLETASVLEQTPNYPSQLILVRLAESANLAEERLSQNCSVSLTLQNFLLSLPKIKL